MKRPGLKGRGGVTREKSNTYGKKDGRVNGGMSGEGEERGLGSDGGAAGKGGTGPAVSQTRYGRKNSPARVGNHVSHLYVFCTWCYPGSLRNLVVILACWEIWCLFLLVTSIYEYLPCTSHLFKHLA